MSIEERLDELEQRLLAAEDQLEIIRLLNTYGPAVDSASGKPASELWTENGSYNPGGTFVKTGRAQIEHMYSSDTHQRLVHTGVSHLTATPRITLHGDTAEAVAYSYVILKRDEEWMIWRAAINHFTLARTPEGWRIVERFNRVLDGSEDSHDTMRKGLV
ncbi:nuclear transport factor 2 family protein [Rhodococcoides yunnanense]|uniref:nuclear transport factor 2 family protein n=1 Tax=Rhodococcoides yunnanense TaxID=278209 RepID=UPI0009328D10|nr:nuclear transport factor 2 family protein [Rhodococcus yunnanensis]